MKQKKELMILAGLFILATTACADTLYLKNGHKIEGLVKEGENDYVELEVCSGSVKFRKHEIEKINKSTQEEIDAIRKKWEKQKIDNQNMVLKRQLEEENAPKKVQFVQEGQAILVTVTLNNKIDALLILDTGAAIVTLRKNIAEKLKINLKNVVPDMIMTLADGRKVNGKRIMLDSLKVEKTEAREVEAAIILDEVGELGSADGLLGMSFLKKYNFKIDQKNKKLILEKF